jgi:hypothetical protein
MVPSLFNGTLAMALGEGDPENDPVENDKFTYFIT